MKLPIGLVGLEKAGSFLNLSDVLLQEATAAGIIMKNPTAGQRVARPGAIIPPIESGNDKKIRGINPSILQQMTVRHAYKILKQHVE